MISFERSTERNFQPSECPRSGAALNTPRRDLGAALEDSVRQIELTQGKVALVDDADYDLVIAAGPWFSHKHVRKFGVRWYARRNVRKNSGETIWLHRFLLKPPSHLVVDHLDENGLNCQRANMTLRTNADNIRRQLHKPGRGTSRFKGVYLDRARGKWAAQVMVNRKNINLGRFDSEEEAGAARRAFDDRMEAST